MSRVSTWMISIPEELLNYGSFATAMMVIMTGVVSAVVGCILCSFAHSTWTPHAQIHPPMELSL